jgi:hypothetical protein
LLSFDRRALHRKAQPDVRLAGISASMARVKHEWLL